MRLRHSQVLASSRPPSTGMPSRSKASGQTQRPLCRRWIRLVCERTCHWTISHQGTARGTARPPRDHVSRHHQHQHQHQHQLITFPTCSQLVLFQCSAHALLPSTPQPMRCARSASHLLPTPQPPAPLSTRLSTLSYPVAPCWAHGTHPASHWGTLAIPLPYSCHIPLPYPCHTLAILLPCPCHTLAIYPCHTLAMPLLYSCLPCPCYTLATALHSSSTGSRVQRQGSTQAQKAKRGPEQSQRVQGPGSRVQGDPAGAMPGSRVQGDPIGGHDQKRGLTSSLAFALAIVLRNSRLAAAISASLAALSACLCMYACITHLLAASSALIWCTCMGHACAYTYARTYMALTFSPPARP